MFGVLQPKGIGVSGLFEALWEQTIRNWTKRAGKRQLTHEQYVAFMVQEISGLFENGFPYRHLINLRPDGKNNAKAKVLRNLGNSLYHPTLAVTMSEALLYYNESIAHAAKGSEARALAYGNRAAVCYHYRRYADCLENVRLARASNYPDRLAAKLKQREEQAKIAMEQNLCEHLQRSGRTTDFVAEELKLCCQAHANVPQMAECLQLVRNAQFGQHIVTSRPLKVGDVVLFEKPFVTMVSHEFRHLRCGYCCSEANCFTLIPCEGCTMEMYCSEECLSKAYQEYHRYECGIVRDLKRIADDPINGVEGIRAVAVAIVTFGNDLDALQKHLNGLDESKVNAFTMDWNTATAKDIYNTVHVLATNAESRDRKDMALQIFHSTIIHRLVLERTELGAMCAANPDRSKLLFDLILRHWQICQTNRKAMDQVVIRVERSEGEGEEESTPSFETFAIGYFPLMSMLNHSCVPNVMRLALNDGRSALVVTKPVDAGEQLFESYFSRDMLDNPVLAFYMEKYYKFICQCAACEIPDGDCYCLANWNDMRFLQKVIMTKPASKRLKPLVTCMNEPGRWYPANQLAPLQLYLMRLLIAMYSAPPTVLLFVEGTLRKHAPLKAVIK